MGLGQRHGNRAEGLTTKITLWATSKRLGVPKVAKKHPVVGPLVALHMMLYKEEIRNAASKNAMKHDGLILATLGRIPYFLLVELELRGWKLVEFSAVRIAHADYRIKFTVEQVDAAT